MKLSLTLHKYIQGNDTYKLYIKSSQGMNQKHVPTKFLPSNLGKIISGKVAIRGQ